MNALDLARTAYSAGTIPLKTPQRLEYEALARVTRKLKASGDGSDDFPALAEALHENRRLWNLLALHIADNDNGLPDDLRARLFYLAEFTSVETSKVLARKTSPSMLVEINTAVMGGLRAQEARR